MFNNLSEYTFKNPEIFFFFILIGIHLIWYLFFRKNINSTIEFSNISFFSNKKSWKERLINFPYILNLIAISLIIISLARPQIPVPWEEKNKTEGIDIIIAMDISGSMLAKDLQPDRLNASKDIAIEFIKKRGNDRIGLVIFSGESFIQCAVTADHNMLINSFENIKWGMIDDGTAIGDGLGTSINHLKHSEAKSKIVILLTDGENTSGKISPITAAKIAALDSIPISDILKMPGKIKVYTIGVGTKGMAQSPVAMDYNGNFIYDYVEVMIDEETLKEIAKITGGQYFRATDNESLSGIYDKINELETTKLPTIIHNDYQEKFYVFSISSLVILLLSFLLQFTYFRTIN